MEFLKKMKKFLIFTMVFVLSFACISTATTKPASAAAREWVDLGSGYKAGFDEPHDKKTGKWHVHIYNGSKEIASENMDGTKHDGSNLSDAPNSAVKKVKATSQWEKYKKKQTALEKARADVKKFSWTDLLFDPAPIILLAGALGVSFYMFTMAQWKALIG